eukprot:scaffold49_cov409-Prasinococcus_capsulatus_cf.AAC.16
MPPSARAWALLRALLASMAARDDDRRPRQGGTRACDKKHRRQRGARVGGLLPRRHAPRGLVGAGCTGRGADRPGDGDVGGRRAQGLSQALPYMFVRVARAHAHMCGSSGTAGEQAGAPGCILGAERGYEPSGVGPLLRSPADASPAGVASPGRPRGHAWKQEHRKPYSPALRRSAHVAGACSGCCSQQRCKPPSVA